MEYGYLVTDTENKIFTVFKTIYDIQQSIKLTYFNNPEKRPTLSWDNSKEIATAGNLIIKRVEIYNRPIPL